MTPAGRDSELRLSDSERDRAAAALGEHFAEGRLRADEHSERLDAVWTARTRSDLVPLFEDLPGRTPYGVLVPERSLRASRRGPGWHPFPFLPILAVLVVLTVVTHPPFVLIALVVGGFLFHRRSRHWHRGWAHSG